MSGFDRTKWKTVKLGEVCEIEKGEQMNRSSLNVVGLYPVYNGGITPSGYSPLWNTERNTIIISEGGNSCGYVNFIKTRFWRGGHCYKVTGSINENFLFYLLKYNEVDIMALRVGSGLPNIQNKELAAFKMRYSQDSEQQNWIVHVLYSIDKHIESLKRLLAKQEAIKQGMMRCFFGD